MKKTTLQLGPLQCHLFGNPASAKRAVVLCHGFGAPGDDLAYFGGFLAEIFANHPEEVLFVFPEAPLSLAHLGYGEGRAWWELNMARLQQLVSTQNWAELCEVTPPGMTEARELLATTIRELQAMCVLGPEQIILGGFSQGAMITSDLALHWPTTFGGLIQFSGMLINAPAWRTEAPRHKGMSVFQSHGTADPVLPFQTAELLRDALTEAGLEVEYHAFSGGHTIDQNVFQQMVEYLKKVL